jgi:hypothetical protein
MADNDFDDLDYTPWHEPDSEDELAKEITKESVARFKEFVEDSHEKLRRLFRQEIGLSDQRVLDQVQAFLEEQAQRILNELVVRVDAITARMAQDYLDLRERVEVLEAQQQAAKVAK